MNIVFFSSYSNHYDPRRFCTKSLPSASTCLRALLEKNPDHSFFVVAEKPAPFLLDLDERGEIEEKARGVGYVILDEAHSAAEDFANEIEKLGADIAISASPWADPFDWLCVKDGMIASILEQKGIRAFSAPALSALNCFDKSRTKEVLSFLGIKSARSIVIKHWLFWCAHAKGGVKENVYRSFVLSEIEKFRYPLVIKDTVGLSSFGTVVVHTFLEAKDFLLSRRNSSDRIVEEYVEGRQFGLEIHGTPEKYEVLPPVEFSTTKHGITSPKQGVKFGPDVSLKSEKLDSDMKKLATFLSIKGIAQVDLVFCENEWTVLEINPRLSGMTSGYAASMNKSVLELLFDIALGKTSAKNMQKTLDFKLPPIENEKMDEIFSQNGVLCVSRIENRFATQKRALGYTTLILDGKLALETLKKLKKNDGELIEDSFLEKAQMLMENQGDFHK